MTSILSRREKLVYLGLAFVAYLLFRHLLGPLAGLDGWLLTVAAYGFAVAAATGYLYHRLRPRGPRPAREE